jgi:hypothetical protein
VGFGGSFYCVCVCVCVFVFAYVSEYICAKLKYVHIYVSNTHTSGSFGGKAGGVPGAGASSRGGLQA